MADKIDPPLPIEAASALRGLGLRLKALRIAQGWTVQEMSERLVCSPTTWRALEAGRPGARIGLLAHALWLLGDLPSLDETARAPALPTANRRVRRRASVTPPGRISSDELDF